MPLTAPAMWAVYLLIFLLGLSVGGFLTVVIHRLPRDGLTLTRPGRFFCPACGAPLRRRDAWPLFSWLWLRGRCRDCGRPIASRYFFVELAAGLLTVYLFHRFGLSAAFLFHLYFVMCLLAVALIDLEIMIIPSVLVYPTMAVALASAVVDPAVALTGPRLWLRLEPILGPRPTALAGALAGLALGWALLRLLATAYRRVRGRQGLGEGDAALLGLIGAFFGWRAVPLVLLGAVLIGLLSVAVMRLNRAPDRPPAAGWGRQALPFGPFLVLAAWLYLFFGPAFIAWYGALTP